MKTIRSKNHENYSLETNKKYLSFFDDKRHISNNGIERFAYDRYLT